MATAFVNNPDYTPIANEAVTIIRAARKGVVRAALVVLAVIMCSVAVVGILIEYGHAPLVIKLIGAVVALGFCGMATGGFNTALWQLLDLPEYGLRVLVLDGSKLTKYQICRFGAEFIICQTYSFDTVDVAATAFERGIVDGHAAAEVFGEDDPHILHQLNTILERLTSQEVIEATPPVGGEFPTHTV